MKLHHSVASPFVRKVRVVAIETGLDGRLELVTPTMTPIKPDADLIEDNPLGKVPCLVTSDGAALYDSRVICEYLDSRHDGAKMFRPRARRAGGRCGARPRAMAQDGCSPAMRRSCARSSGAGRSGSKARKEVPPRPRQPRWRGR